jgi:hypothetical protein
MRRQRREPATRRGALRPQRRELGSLTAEDAPAWALDALGPVPGSTDPAQVVARQDWEHRAGWAAAYRELVGHTDEHDPLGNAPGKGRIEHGVMFRAAHEALALVDARAEEANLSDGALRARVRAYERELAWAPRWVEDDLAAAHQHRSRAATDATVWAARAEAPDTSQEDADRLRADAEGARAEAARLAERIAELEIVDSARAAWFTYTAVSRDNAERSRTELRARGVDPDRPDDRTTAPEGLGVHRAEQADRERDQPITEADVLPDDHDQLGFPRDEPGRADDPPEVVETAVPDLRAVSTPEATETADPPEGGRVLPIDESTVAVRKAQATLAEIAERQAADTAWAEADAADREAAEAARREELTRRQRVDCQCQRGGGRRPDP